VVPLITPFRETGDMVQVEFNKQHKRAEALARVEATEEAAASYTKQAHGLMNLHAFCQDMECDFPSACAFDFENLNTQLEMASNAPEPQQGLDLIMSTYGANEVVYDDLIRAIQTSSGPKDVELFRLFVSVVRRAAERVHNKFGRGAASPDNRVRPPVASSQTIADVQKAVDCQKARISKLEKEQNDVAGSIGIEAEMARDREISSLKDQVSKAESLLKWKVENEARYDKPTNASNPGLSWLDEERAAQFRGRQFFVTKGGFLGLASPGVSDIRVGDQVVLLDGLTFPLVARACPDSRLAVVGCANVRGVKLHHKVEDVELWEGKSAGPKHILAFV
jgi:hypothetical protein